MEAAGGLNPSAPVRRPSPGVPSRSSEVQTGPAPTVLGRDTRVSSDVKSVASGNGIAVGIGLAEPLLFLRGFEPRDMATGNTALLRGALHLKVTKATKIKAVTLKFKGTATTKWPEGIPPKKVEFEETDTIMSHTWPFFNAQFPTAEHGSCADVVDLYQCPPSFSTKDGLLSPDSNARPSSMIASTSLSGREKRHSLQLGPSRSFNKSDPANSGSSVAQKGYRTFQPGEYAYHFELPLDSHLPETIDVELGFVKYELEAIVERAGAFKANLFGSREVTLIRTPSESSLEQVEPIAISRTWDDQLHYDIVISGKSFPLGSQVPIAFKLTPLAKVQCHRIKVFITENMEYFCKSKHVHRLEPVRKFLLYEKRSDGTSTTAFPGSTARILSGGGVPFDQRSAAARGEEITPQDPSNLLGSLEGDLIGPTEMEVSVQLPWCASARDRDKYEQLHFDTTYPNIQVHHWIKIVLRLSRLDQNDPTRRRHFEISIDSPFNILSCRANQANTELPAYSAPESAEGRSGQFECGCPGASPRQDPPNPFFSNPNAAYDSRQRGASQNRPEPSIPTRPQQAHIGGPNDHTVQRPIHLLRAPSFNPPAFDDDGPPPELITPPPQYESIASPTSGLADYFARLSDAYDDDSDNDFRHSGPSRVNVPLTPGRRVNRSMDEPRTWLPVGSEAR